MEVGALYRITMKIRAPYTVENIERLEAGWRLDAGVTGSITIESFTVSFPVGGVWKATVEYRVKKSATFGFNVDSIGRIATDLISTIMSAVALVFTSVEKFTVDTVSGVAGAVAGPIKEVLNPGVLILVVVGIFLIVRR
jgi:hypothetical protein